MTRLMDLMVERLRALPLCEQEAMATFILHELAEDERWATSTRDHADKLKKLAANVLADDAAR